MFHYYEKLIISIVIFLGVVIGTSSIVGNYVKQVERNKRVTEDRIIIGNL